MKVLRNVAIFCFLFCGVSYSQTIPTQVPVGHIDNFGKVDEKIYRGAQPVKEDFIGLKELGVHTVINLRDDPKDYEKPTVEALGMIYINIPMSGWMYPREKDIQRILKLLNDPNTGEIFIHCKAGIHRTGVAIAVYRIHTYHWSYDEASKEMKAHLWFGISAIWHIRLRSYVKDYAKRKVV
jgi:protein tyrosine/serine phosphatase